jgi:acyl-CoA synthetase (AMP-forming)/AMP-acid ligase II
MGNTQALEQGLDGHRTLIEALLAAPSTRPFVTVWVDEDEIYTITFGEFVSEARRRAAALRKKGLRSGQTVILVVPQGIPLMTTFAACMLLGAVPTILAYPSFKVDPVKYRTGLIGISQNLRASLVIVDEEFPSELLAHVESAEGASLVQTNEIGLDDKETELPDVHSCPDDLAFIQHSAGTTGLQKGVALTHKSVLTQLEHLAKAIAVNSDDRIYSWLPLYHDMGLIVPNALKVFTFGGSPMWGTGSPDWSTIPAYLRIELEEARRRPLCIMNFGESAYVSTQSVIELMLQLQAGNVPDIAIFTDGVNDIFTGYQSGKAGIHQNFEQIAARLEGTGQPRPLSRLLESFFLYGLGSKEVQK